MTRYYREIMGDDGRIIAIPGSPAELGINPYRMQTPVADGRVSTIFLIIDAGWSAEPMVYETLLLQPEWDAEDYCARYSTREEAIAGHWALVMRLGGATGETVISDPLQRDHEHDTGSPQQDHA